MFRIYKPRKLEPEFNKVAYKTKEEKLIEVISKALDEIKISKDKPIERTCTITPRKR